MFTGLIREIGEVKSLQNNILTIKSNLNPKIGDSIAVNGVCLTVISISDGLFSVELSTETRDIIDSSNFRSRVHLEPAMAVNDRFEGHIVQGHIDCIGEVKEIQKKENGTDFIIKVPREYIKYIVPKGSIAIDGVSLTVNDVYKDSFRLTIIPHTLKETLIKNYKIGTKVNIETDIFARYIEHILNHNKKDKHTWSYIDSILMSY
jgi:riboflavin synthase